MKYIAQGEEFSEMQGETTWKILTLVKKGMTALPYKAAVSFGAGLGTLLWALSKKKVDEAERSCVRSLQVGVTTARTIVRSSYANLGRSVGEFVSAAKKKADLGALVEIHGEEHLREALARGRGVILLSAHMGNWELGAGAVAARGYPMNGIGADQRDDRITQLIIDTREEYGVKTVSKGFDLKSAIRCLKQGEILAILVDQDAGRNGVVVPFLGLPASTPYGPAKMAQHLGSTILPVFMIRRGKTIYHDLYILPSPWEEGYPDREESMESAMERCNEIISGWISRYPEQWMWLSRRWASIEKKLS